ncbi:conserved repeat domain protein [gamma proteobacterium HTCC5015]|nr:conserved repeat domain protein [gamma proteobacterium HTCC5015]
MKILKQHPKGWPSKRLSTAVLLALGGVLASGVAQANTSAGTTLQNAVTVDYTDAGGTAQAQISDSVDVTVDHVADVAWGAAPAGQATSSGDTLPSAYTIDLTNTGNGSDSYNITDNTSETCAGGTLTAESFAFTTPVVLGATVSAAAATDDGTNTTIEVSNMTVADFTAGDIVVINNGATEYTVVSATAGATATDNDELVVSGVHTGDFNAAGLQIGERAEFSYGATGTAGTLSGGPASCTHDHSIVATGTTATGGNTQSTDTVSGWVTTVNGVTLTVDKYVRNVTTAAKNPGAADITFDSVDYYATGVTGNPGETLEYLVVIDNATAGNAAGVEFNDTLPAFTGYVTSSIEVDTDGDGTFDVALPGDETEADSEGGIVTQSGSSIQVFAGTGGDEDTDTGGNIAGSSNSVVKYQVTID